MLTPEGIALLWRLAAGQSDDTIDGWKLVVSDGSARSEAPVGDPVITPTDNGAEVTLTATFSGDDANHEWASRDVVSGQGIVVDTEVEDNGRKAQGSEWSIEATIELAAANA